jgi:UrcA family protein
MKTLPLLIAAVLVAPVAGASTVATVEDTVRQRAVEYADLHLHRSADAEVLYQRIAVAARHVCAARGMPTLSIWKDIKRCAAQATARAVADVDAPLLTRYFAMQNGSGDDAVVYGAALGGAARSK